MSTDMFRPLRDYMQKAESPDPIVAWAHEHAQCIYCLDESELCDDCLLEDQ